MLDTVPGVKLIWQESRELYKTEQMRLGKLTGYLINKKTFMN